MNDPREAPRRRRLRPRGDWKLLGEQRERRLNGDQLELGIGSAPGANVANVAGLNVSVIIDAKPELVGVDDERGGEA